MRKLNKRQEALLRKLHDEKDVKNVEQIPYDDWQKLVKWNDHETLYQNANAFLWDLNWERA